MNCCQCQGIEAEFNQNTASRGLKRYRKQGPAKTTRLLIDALKAGGVKGMTLLDIGGGIGAIQHELLSAGASSATNVDASTAHIEAAKQEAERQGHTDQVSYHYGDFVELARDIDPADMVTLDRVICCYHDMQSLVGLAAARARKLVGLVYPRETWWLKIVFAIMNLIFRARRDPFRVFLHHPQAVDAVLRSNGLEQRFYRETAVWQVVVYAR